MPTPSLAGADSLATAELLRSAAIRRRDRLRRAAVPLGQRLYADRPGAFARRLDACWQARETQAAADARWLAPEAAGLVRELLERRQAVGPERRRVTKEMRGLGFPVTELATLAECRPPRSAARSSTPWSATA